MNFQWLTSPEWANIVQALLHTLWEAVVAAVLLGVALRNIRNPVARYRWALTALVAVVFAGLVTWAVLYRPLAHSNSDNTGLQEHAEAKSGSGVPPLNLTSAPPLSSNTIEPAPTESHWTAWLALLWLAGAPRP